MKKILFFGLFLCLGMTLKAQYGGEMTIGARLNYTGGGKLVTYDGKIVNLGYTIKGIVSPGYFVTNNIALGADLAYEYMMDDEGHQYTLETGGFFRLYAPRGGVRLYLQGTSGYGWGKSFLKKGHDGKHELWVSTLKPGLWARLKEYLALDISLMSLEYKEVYMRDFFSNKRVTDSRWRYNWLDISFGVVFIIGL